MAVSPAVQDALAIPGPGAGNTDAGGEKQFIPQNLPRFVVRDRLCGIPASISLS